MNIDKLNTIVILQDNKEQRPLDFSAFPFASTKVVALGENRGDYSIEGYEGRFAIERKSLADLIGTILQYWKGLANEKAGRAISHENGSLRFRNELEYLASLNRMDAATGVPAGYGAIVVEALEVQVYKEQYRSMVKGGSIIGEIRALSMRYHVPFLFAGNSQMASRMVYELAYYFTRENLKGIPMPPRYRLPTPPKLRSGKRRRSATASPSVQSPSPASQGGAS